MWYFFLQHVFFDAKTIILKVYGYFLVCLKFLINPGIAFGLTVVCISKCLNRLTKSIHNWWMNFYPSTLSSTHLPHRYFFIQLFKHTFTMVYQISVYRLYTFYWYYRHLSSNFFMTYNNFKHQQLSIQCLNISMNDHCGCFNGFQIPYFFVGCVPK